MIVPDVMNRPMLDCLVTDEEVVLQPACHLLSPVYVSYKDGILEITCLVCNKSAAKIKVADK